MNGFKKLVVIDADESTKWIQAEVDSDGVLRAGEKFCYNKNIMTAADILAVKSGADMPEKALRMGINAGGREVLTAEDFRNREFNAAAAAAGLTVKHWITHGRDESGQIPVYHYLFASGREWVERNIFDFGRIINPAFSVFGDGENGGIVANKPIAGALALSPLEENPENLYVTINHYNDKAKSRKLTDEEAKEYRFVSEHGFAGRGIRM